MRMEIYRLFHNRKLLYALLGLLMLNVGLFLYENSQVDSEYVNQLVSEQGMHRNTYAEYVNEVIDDAKSMVDSPLFVLQNSEFSKQNAKNIAKAYERIVDIEVMDGNDIPVIAFLDFLPMIYISIIMIVLIAFDAVRDQRKGMDLLLYTSSKGRCLLGIRRCAYIVFISCVIVAVNMLVILLLSVYKYGGEIIWERSIQSISLFRDFTYDVSILGFLIRYYGLMVAGISIIGLFVWACMSLCSNMLVATLVLSGVSIMEYNWKVNVTAQSNFNLLKYVNVIEVLDVEDYLFKYYDINIGGNAVNLLGVIIIGLLSFVVCFSLLGIYAFMKRTSSNRVRWNTALLEKVHILQEHYSLILTELHKVLIFNKGILVIAISIMIALGIVNQRTIVYTEEEQYVNTFYETYSGKITSEVYEFIENEHLWITSVYENFGLAFEEYKSGQISEIEFLKVQAELRLAQIAEKGLMKIDAEISRAELLEEERGIKIQLLNNFGYNKLFGIDGKSTQKGIMISCLLAFAILFSGNFTFEKSSQNTYLLRASCRGRIELMHTKEVTVVLIGLLIFYIMHLIHIYYVSIQYGLPNIMAPVQSIAILQNFPVEVSILDYSIIVLIVRIIVYLVMALCLLYCSLIVEQKHVLAFFSIVFILPILLDVSMISCFDLLSLNGVVIGLDSLYLVMVKGGIIIVGAIVTRRIAYKKWCG